jgi:hypothetical protein
MFFPEFKELLDYSVKKFEALNKVDDSSTETELSGMPFV